MTSMKTPLLILTALWLCLPTAFAQETPVAPPATPAWVIQFNKLPEETRKSYISQFKKAEQFFANKRIIECLFALEGLDKLYAGNPGLYNLRGACYIEIRNVAKALENFQQALSLDPDNLTIPFNLAEAHYVNHDYATALKAFTDLLPQFKNNPGILPLVQFKRYICALKLGNTQLAKELESLHGPMDDTPYYYCTKAVSKFLNGQKDQAQEELLSAIRIYQGTNALQSFTDAMTEAGILPSPYGQTVPDTTPERTGLEKSAS